MSAENERSTQGVKIHTSASAKRDDKSATRTKMQPSGVPSSPAGADERRPSHTRKAATRTAAPRLQRNWLAGVASRTPRTLRGLEANWFYAGKRETI
jgi:hypothetical protein